LPGLPWRQGHPAQGRSTKQLVAVLAMLACNAAHVAHAAIPGELNPLGLGV
jgi:hypothetical protein